MHWYRVVQTAIGEELHHYMSQNNAGFWMLWFDRSFNRSMTRSFKRSMWRAGSGDGHHVEWREFHGGSAATTHSDQLWSHLSQPVSALQPTEAVQSRRFRKTCVRPTVLSIFIGCTALWIWMDLVQVWLDLSKEACEEEEVEMDIIWNEENFMEARRPPHSDQL